MMMAMGRLLGARHDLRGIKTLGGFDPIRIHGSEGD
jgi:hypothetical protein